MGRDEVCAVVGDLVVFDDDEAGDEQVEGEEVEGEVREGAAALLGRGVGWLEDEDALGEGEEGAAVEDGVGGEEDEGVEEYACPDGGDEEDDACLSYGCCACGREGG